MHINDKRSSIFRLLMNQIPSLINNNQKHPKYYLT